jgi:adenylate kinase family enzyme
MQPTILAIIGKPLVGKDTQANRLVADAPDAVNISTGHIIREVARDREQHRFWPILGPYTPMMEAGLKLPDEPIMDMLGTVIAEHIKAGKKLLVVAGSPRSFEQLDEFMNIAYDTGANFLVMHLDASDAETHARSAARNEGRIDDTPDMHDTRLAEYTTHVLPVVVSLRRQGLVIDINSMQPVDEVYRDIRASLSGLLPDPEITLPTRARR